MVFAFCAVLIIVLIAALVFQDRAHKRSMEAQQGVMDAYRVEVAQLLERFTRERESHRIEIQSLCQRIQAPEVAVMQHQIETAGPPEATYPLSDNEAAQREAQEIAARIAEMERKEAMNGY